VRSVGAREKPVDFATSPRIITLAALSSLGAEATAETPDAFGTCLVTDAQPGRDGATRDALADPIENRTLLSGESLGEVSREALEGIGDL
jgi:hypothetical protein